MALVLADRVNEVSITTGTGNFTLAGAVTGFQSFSSAIGAGNTTYYTIECPATGEWECGLGTLSGATTLERTTVYASSNSGSAVNFSAGTKSVFVSMAATKWPAGVLGTANGGTGTTLTTGSGANVYTDGPAISNLTYGGVALSNSVTGTGSMVLSASPSFTGSPFFPQGTIASRSLSIGTSGTYGNGIAANAYDELSYVIGGSAVFHTAFRYSRIGSTHVFGWTNSEYNPESGTVDIALHRVSANVLGLSTAYGPVNTNGTLTLGTINVGTAANISGPITYGGVTLANSVTGTGSMVLSAGPTLTGALTAGTASFNGGVFSIGGDTNGAVEIGGVSKSPYIDWHSYSGGVNDYDVRMQVTGGTGASGNGTLSIYAGSTVLTGTLSVPAGTFTSSLTSNGYVYSNTTTGAMARFVLQNTNRTWSISNYGTTYAPNGRFAIADETGAATWFTIDTGGATNLYGATTIGSALTYGGVTLSNAVTGTGAMVLSTAPSFGGTVTFSSMTGTNLYTTTGVMQMTRDSATGGGLIFVDTASGGQNWQCGPGTGSGDKDYWGVYNFSTTTTVLNVSKAGVVSTASKFTAPYINATTGHQFNGTTILRASGSYVVLNDISSSDKFLIGNSGDPTNYYRNSVHYFQTTAGAANILNMTGTLATFAVPLNYGGVTLSNSVTGTGSMVLSASPTFTGTVTAGAVAMTGVDGQPIGYVYSSSGMIRMWGYTASAALIDACTANQATYIDMRLTGTSIYMSSSGTDILTVASGGVTVASGKTLQLGNAYVAGAPTATGYVTIKDSAGTTYKVLVGT